MEHLEIHKKYIDELENIDYRMIDCRFKENDYDYDKLMAYQFKQLDCSRVLSNGMRNIQTIDVAYRVEMAMTIAIIDRLDDSKKDEYIAKLNELHFYNLTFEINNPPIDYSTKVKSKKTSSSKSTRKSKQEEFAFSKQVKAEQSLNRKLKEYASLNFKIKIK